MLLSSPRKEEGKDMKKNKKLIALILSAVLWITSVSPVFAAEFFAGEKEQEETAFSEDSPQEVLEEELPAEGTPEEGTPEEETLKEDTPEEGASREVISSETADAEIFSDTEDDWDAGEEEAAVSEFGDGSSEELFQSSEGERFICTVAPIRREDEFTPIGNGCDAPSPEEVIAEAGPELFTSGSETESADPADVNALTKASEELRTAMVKRTGKTELSLKLSFEVDDDEWEYVIYSLLLMAFEETGNSWEGDYLRWHFQETGECLIAYEDSTGTYSIYLPFVFYTTYAQEQQVTNAVNSALAGLGITDKTTPYMRIKKIYDYICATVTYDDAHVGDSSYYPQFTAYAAIINKTAVCQGYSLLLYRMLMEAGIENRMIPSENHIWNLIYLRGLFYNADATWDAGVIPEYYEYFLKGSNSFEANVEHVRDTEDPFSDYNSAEFKNAYPTSAADYVVQESDIPSNGECTHVWNAWETVIKPDCVSEGIKCRTCSKCGEEDYEVVPVTAHKWKYTASAKKNNTHTAKCSVCGTSKTLKCVFEKNICTKCKAQRIPTAAKITRISSVGINKLKITWDKVEGATGYEISYLKGKTWKVIGKTTGTTYTHTGNTTYPVKTGVTCYFRVRAICTVNSKTTYGTYSAKAGGKAVAAKPVLVSVKAKAYNKVTITWKKAAGATHYLIYRKNGTKWERVATLEGANITSYTHTSSKAYPVNPGTSYVYTVRSYTNTGNTYGLYDKNGKSVKTSLGKVSLTITRTQSGLKNSWKKINGATGYQVQRYTGGKWSVIKTVNSKTLSYIDTAAKKGASYQYRVRAYRVFNGKRVYGSYSAVRTGKR